MMNSKGRGRYCGLRLGYTAICLVGLSKSMRIIWIAGFLAKIRTKNALNTSLGRDRYTNLFGRFPEEVQKNHEV
jgi:hypothetical protein